MSDYIKATNFASKDALTTGNPLKTVSGTEIDDEFTSIASAVSSKANISSPAFTGTPTAPTAATASNSTQISTTAHTQAAATAITTAAIVPVTASIATKAPLASPALTGSPTAPTAATASNSTQVATTAFAQAAIVAGVAAVTASNATKAPLASPALTGNPTAPTQSVGNNSTRLATTAFVQTAIPALLTGAEILTSIKTVDGTGSGLDADLLDGNHASAFLTPTGDGSQLTGISSFSLPSQASLTLTSMTGNTNGTYASANLGSGGAGWYYFQDFTTNCLLQYALGWHNDSSNDDGILQYGWADTAGIFYCTTTPRLYSLRWGNNNNIYTGGSIKWVKIS